MVRIYPRKQRRIIMGPEERMQDYYLGLELERESMEEKEKYPVGTKVYYSSEDYNTGEDVIYEGEVQDIYYHTLNLGGKELNMKLYKINDGLSMQCNAFYTLEELMSMANRLQYLLNEFDKEAAINKDVVLREEGN